MLKLNISRVIHLHLWQSRNSLTMMQSIPNNTVAITITVHLNVILSNSILHYCHSHSYCYTCMTTLLFLLSTTTMSPLAVCEFALVHHWSLPLLPLLPSLLYTSQYNANNRTTPLLSFPIILLFSCMTTIPHSFHWLLSSCPLIFATIIMLLRLCSQPSCLINQFSLYLTFSISHVTYLPSIVIPLSFLP